MKTYKTSESVRARARQRYWANREHKLEYQRSRREQNPRYQRDYELKRKFGITLEEYEELFDTQGGVCFICGQPCSSGRSLAVDHDHSTGKVRGLLCGACNTGIGKLQDDPELLRKAAEYLEAALCTT